MKKFKIITDSGCDINMNDLNQHGIVLLPFEVRFDDEKYYDRLTLSPDDFYKKLTDYTGVPKTSLVTPGTFKEAFELALSEAETVIYFGFSSKLSGTFQSALLAKSMLGSDHIHLIDCKGASAGQAIILFKAVEMIAQGCSKAEILSTISYMVDNLKYYFAVGNLEMLFRGGRLSSGAALMGTVLNIKPILTFDDGNIVPYEKVRGNKAMFRELMNRIREDAKDIANQTLGIAYSGTDPALSEQLIEMIKAEFGVTNFIRTQMGAAIGSHVGQGTVGVCFIEK